jgi:hypothetical protein
MLTPFAIANQKMIAAYAAHAATSRQDAQACLRTVYSLRVAEMMMAGDLSDLPTTEEK